MYMKIAIEEALKGMNKGDGGAFGAVIVKDNKIIAQAHNEVIKTNDPTMHAEVNVIRKATRKLKRFDLSDCILFTTCEPCPMCLGAIYWAKIKRLYMGCTAEDAEKIGFSDKFIYDIIRRKRKSIPMIRINRKECLELFKLWQDKKDKIQY